MSWHYTNPTKRVGRTSSPHWKLTCSRHYISELALNNNLSLTFCIELHVHAFWCPWKVINRWLYRIVCCLQKHVFTLLKARFTPKCQTFNILNTRYTYLRLLLRASCVLDSPGPISVIFYLAAVKQVPILIHWGSNEGEGCSLDFNQQSSKIILSIDMKSNVCNEPTAEYRCERCGVHDFILK